MNNDLLSLVRQSLIAELEGLRDQVRQLADPLNDQEFWRKPVDPGNSVGHLVLHLTGNLKYFVGAQLGKTGYVRDREREFAENDVPSKTAALQELDAAVGVFHQVVKKMSTEQLQALHPEQRFGIVLKALLHLITHFALHRGQMSYIARLVKPQVPQ